MKTVGKSLRSPWILHEPACMNPVTVVVAKQVLSLCMLGSFWCFLLSFADFSKLFFVLKKAFENSINMSNSFDSDQDPDLGLNCLQQSISWQQKSWLARKEQNMHACSGARCLKSWPRRDTTCLRGFRQCETQTSLLSYRD